MDDPALREDALRQRPAPRAAGGRMARERLGHLRALRARNSRLDDAGDAIAGGRLLLFAGRGQRTRGRKVLRLGPRRGEAPPCRRRVRRYRPPLWTGSRAELREKALALACVRAA